MHQICSNYQALFSMFKDTRDSDRRKKMGRSMDRPAQNYLQCGQLQFPDKAIA